MPIGLLGSRTVDPSSRSIVTVGFSPSDSASVKAAPRSLTTPAGTRAAVRSCAQASAGRADRARSSSSRSSSRPLTRAVLVAKRASSISSLYAEHLAQRCPLALVADRDHQLALAGPVQLVRRDAGVGVAHPVWNRAGDRVARPLVDQRREQRESRSISTRWPSPVARGGAAPPGCRRSRTGPRARRRARPRPSAAPVRVAGDAHQAAHGLDQEVVAGRASPRRRRRSP